MPNHLEKDRIDPEPRADDRVLSTERPHLTFSRVTSDFVRSAWSRFRAATSGSVAIIFSLAAPVVLAMGASAVEYSSLSNHRSQLQDAVDAATLAATRELSLSNANEGTVEQVLETVVAAHMLDAPSVPSLQSSIDRDSMTVTVEATMEVALTFGSLLGMDAVTIGVRAAGQALGQPNICVLGLHSSSAETIYLGAHSQLTGNDCAVFSNSTSSSGIRGAGQSLLSSSTTCTAGGFDGGQRNFNPMPFVDCPRFEDPLLHREPPEVAGCDFTGTNITGGTHTLYSGVYCGGLELGGNADVRFSPGVYIIKDGEFRALSNVRMAGLHVGFYLSGAGTRFYFGPNVHIDFEAPVDGDMAGLLFFSDRAQSGSVENEIKSNFAHNLVGTVYLPRAELHVKASRPVASESAYTAIVVNRLELTVRPHLVLNADYDETDVPVPDGIRGAGQPIRLIE